MLNTNISKYFNYTFDELVETKNFNAEISRKDGLKIFFDVHVTPIKINDNKIELIYFQLLILANIKNLKARKNILKNI